MGTTGIVEPIDIFEQRFTKFILVMVGVAVGFLVFEEFEKTLHYGIIVWISPSSRRIAQR